MTRVVGVELGLVIFVHKNNQSDNSASVIGHSSQYMRRLFDELISPAHLAGYDLLYIFQVPPYTAPISRFAR